MSRGNFKITRDHSEVDREPQRASSWLDQFAEKYAEKEGKTAVEVARERTQDIPSIHDQIQSIMNGRPTHRTVEDAVQDYQERTGLTEYLKSAQAGDQVKDAAALIKGAEDDDTAEELLDPDVVAMLAQMPEGSADPKAVEEAFKGVTDPRRGLPKRDYPLTRPEGMSDADWERILAQEEAEVDPVALSAKERENVEWWDDVKDLLFELRMFDKTPSKQDTDDDAADSDEAKPEPITGCFGPGSETTGVFPAGTSLEDVKKKKSPTKENLVEALEKLLDKLKDKEPSEEKEEKKDEDEEEEPEIVRDMPEIAQFIHNVIENSPGIHFPAVIQLIAETFGRDLSPSQLDDPILIRYIDKRRRPPKGSDYSANLGRGLGTQRDTDLFGDIQNNDPFSFGRPSSRY